MAKKPKMVLTSKIWKCDVAKLKDRPCVTNEEVLEAGRKVGKTRKTFYADVHYINKNQLPKEFRPKEDAFFVAVTLPFTSMERVVEDIEESIVEVFDGNADRWEHGEPMESEVEEIGVYPPLRKRARRRT